MLLFRMAQSDARQEHEVRCMAGMRWMHILQPHASHYSTPTETVHSLVSNSHYSLVISASYISNLTYTWTQPPTFPTSRTHGLNLLHFQPHVHIDSTAYISNLTYTWTQLPTFPTSQTHGLNLLHFQPHRPLDWSSYIFNPHAHMHWRCPPFQHYQHSCTEDAHVSNTTNTHVLMHCRCPRFQHHQPSCTHALKLSIFPMLPTLVYTGRKKPSRQWEDWGKEGRGGKYRKKKKSKQSISMESGVLGSGPLQGQNCINHAIHIIQGAKRFCFSTSTCWTSQGPPFIFVGGGCNVEIQTMSLSQTTRKANGRGEVTVYDRSPNQQLRWLCDRGW